METPFLLAGVGVDRIEIAVPASEIEDALCVGRRGMHDVPGLEFPFQCPGYSVERVEVAVAAAEIHRAARDDRARQEDVKDVDHRLVLRQVAVQVLRLEAALAFGGEFPARRAGACVERMELAVVARYVNDV